MDQLLADQMDWGVLEPPLGLKIFLTVLYSLILVLGVLGNSATIRVAKVLQQSGEMQQSVSDHLLSLACSALLVLLLGVPVQLLSAIWFPLASTSAEISCRIHSFLLELCSYATLLNVATLSLQRYLAICKPFKYRHHAKSRRRTLKLLLLTWFLSTLVALPVLVATGVEEIKMPGVTLKNNGTVGNGGIKGLKGIYETGGIEGVSKNQGQREGDGSNRIYQTNTLHRTERSSRTFKPGLSYDVNGICYRTNKSREMLKTKKIKTIKINGTERSLSRGTYGHEETQSSREIKGSEGTIGANLIYLHGRDGTNTVGGPYKSRRSRETNNTGGFKGTDRTKDSEQTRKTVGIGGLFRTGDPFRTLRTGKTHQRSKRSFGTRVNATGKMGKNQATEGLRGITNILAEDQPQNLSFCTSLSSHWIMYRISIFTAFLVYLGVMISVAFMCRAMILVLRAPMEAERSGEGGANLSRHESARLKASRKQTILFLVLVVSSLCVCWTPLQILRLMTASLPRSSWSSGYLKAFARLYPVAGVFFYLSSLLNPLLFSLSSRSFRHALRHTLECSRAIVDEVSTQSSSRVPGRERVSRNTLRPLLKLIRLDRSSSSGEEGKTTDSQEQQRDPFSTLNDEHSC